MEAPYIVVDRVTKTYRTAGDDLTAIDDVSFTVGEGEFVAIVGPSGCGKSTLLRLVAGLRAASSGTITVAGTPVTSPLRIGMVFQAPALLPWRTTLDNVLLAVDLAGLRRKAYRERAQALLELVGLAEFSKRRPSELSGGMQQRVALCRALLCDPPLLLMDEPFGALDAMTRDEMNFELLRIWTASAEKKTVLFVTHSIPEAVFLADRICVMTARPGEIQEIVASTLQRPRTLAMRGSADFGQQVVHIYQQLHATHREGGRLNID